MRALLVVVRDIAAQPGAHVTRGRIVPQIDVFIFDRPPEPLNKDIIQGPPFPIHADFGPRRFQQSGVLRARKVTAHGHQACLRRGKNGAGSVA